MGEVVNPRAETYSVTFHQWFTSGVCFMRILPTICVHMCTVASVSCHSSRMSSGQVLLGICRAVKPIQQFDAIAAILLRDRKSTRLNSSHMSISYAVFCLKKK